MKIAIVKLSSIGDIVHAAFIPQAINAHLPHVKVDWFCDENFTHILDLNPHINRVYPVISKNAKKKTLAFFSQFRGLRRIGKQNRYNIVIDLQGTFKSAMVATAISTNKNLWGFRYTRDRIANKMYKKYSNCPLTHNVYHRAIHIVNQALECSITQNDVTIPFIYTHTDLPQKNNLSAEKKSVLLFPFSSTAAKNYPAENFAKLISQMDTYNVTLLYGSQKERITCEDIAKMSGIDGVKIIGNKTLGEIKELLPHYDCIIGADTGILHIASALGIKNITLYGPTPQYRTAINLAHGVTLQGNGNVNKISHEEILRTLKLLIG